MIPMVIGYCLAELDSHTGDFCFDFSVNEAGSSVLEDTNSFQTETLTETKVVLIVKARQF